MFMTLKQKLTLRIMHLAYLVHENTGYCVFIDFSGHINQTAISIRHSKERWQERVLETEFYDQYVEAKGSQYPYLESIIKVLENILANDDIPYDELDYEEEYSRVYHI